MITLLFVLIFVLVISGATATPHLVTIIWVSILLYFLILAFAICICKLRFNKLVKNVNGLFNEENSKLVDGSLIWIVSTFRFQFRFVILISFISFRRLTFTLAVSLLKLTFMNKIVTKECEFE
jgi:hypothetical protein